MNENSKLNLCQIYDYLTDNINLYLFIIFKCK